MTAPYPDLTDQYRTDGDEQTRYSSLPHYTPSPSTPLVPYTPAGLPSFEMEEARRERRAVTLRITIALVMAVPLTAIGGGMVNSFLGGVGSLSGMALSWIGIALIVYLSHGRGFPFPKQ